MSVNVSTDIVINRPLNEVAMYSANPERAPEWYQNIKAVHWKTTPPLRAGSRLGFVADFLGRTLEYTYEAVEYIPGQRLVMRTAEGPFPMETSYEWAAIADGATRMTLRNRGRPSGFSKVLSPFMAMAVRRANRKDLRQLKTILERGEASKHDRETLRTDS